QPYRLGRTEVATASAALDREETRPAGKRQLRDLEASVASWKAWDQGQVAIVDANGPAVDVAASEQGKALFDSLQSQSTAYQAGLAAAAAGADARARSQSIVFLAVLLACVLAGITALAIFATRFFRATLSPLVRLVDVAAQLAAGGKGKAVEIPGTQRRDEVGRLARSLAAWEQSAGTRLTLAQAMLEVSSEVDLERVIDLGVNRVRTALGAAEVFVRLRSADDGVVYSSVSNLDPRPGGGADWPGRVAREPGQERVPGQHEPRAADPAQRHPRLQRAADRRRRRPLRRADPNRVPEDDQQQRPAPARADQRHPRPGQDRGGPPGGGPRGH